MKAQNILQTIGDTPHIRIQRLFGHATQAGVDQVASAPTRAARSRTASRCRWSKTPKRSGALKPGGTIVEPTSGNTGIGLAMVAAVKGYKLVLVMPDSMSVERRRLMLAYGATLRPDAAREGHEGLRSRAPRRSWPRTPGAWMPQQFDNPANVEVHARTTARGDRGGLSRRHRRADHRRRHRRPHHRLRAGAEEEVAAS